MYSFCYRTGLYFGYLLYFYTSSHTYLYHVRSVYVCTLEFLKIQRNPQSNHPTVRNTEAMR